MKINKKYVFYTIFVLAWLLTIFLAAPDSDQLKFFIITGIYFCIGVITVMAFKTKELYKQLKIKTGDEAIIAKCDFEYDLSIIGLLAACGAMEIIYCCLQGFNLSSFLHGLVWVAACFPMIYFVSAFVFQKRCKTLVRGTKSLAGIEIDEKILYTFKPFQKSLITVLVLLDTFAIVGYFRKDFIETLMFVSIFAICFAFLFLNESKHRALDVLYDLEGTKKNFHLDVSRHLQDTYLLMIIALVFVTGSMFSVPIVVKTSTFAPEMQVLLFVAGITIVNLCFSLSNMDYVRLNYLVRMQKEEQDKQQVQQPNS